MGKHVVRWNRSAYRQMVSIAAWYRENVALKAASSFINGIHKAVEQISSYPTLVCLIEKGVIQDLNIIVYCYIRSIG